MSDLFTLHHVSLYVRDVDASAFFDATVLGLAEIPNRVGESHIRWFIIDGFRTFHLIGGDPEPE
jgi:lactoylglutathione lyase